MTARPTAIERAFELAGTGQFSSVQLIRLQLKKEKYQSDQIEGRGLVKQLREIIRGSGAILPPPRVRRRP